MFSVSTNTATQHLNITIRHIYDAEDLKSLKFMVEQEVSQLSTGWTAAMDLRGMSAIDEKLLVYLKQIHIIFQKNNVGRIVTLVDNVILKMQLILMGKEAGTYSISSRFSNEQEWREYLQTPRGFEPPSNPIF